MGRKTWPNWTVVYSIPGHHFTGVGTEFFYNEAAAVGCYEYHDKLGYKPAKREFRGSDKVLMHPADRSMCEFYS